MEVSNEEYVKAAQASLKRLAKLCDYQEEHILTLEQAMRERDELIASLQEELQKPQTEEDSED